MATPNRLARVRDRLQPRRRLRPPSVPWAPTDPSPPRVLLECPPESSPAVVSSGPRPPAIVALLGPDDPEVSGAVSVDRRVGGAELVGAVHRALDAAQRREPAWGD